jgi:hypothetical protein
MVMMSPTLKAPLHAEETVNSGDAPAAFEAIVPVQPNSAPPDWESTTLNVAPYWTGALS